MQTFLIGNAKPPPTHSPTLSPCLSKTPARGATPGQRLEKLLAHDFATPRGRSVAEKNGYILLRKRNFKAAVAVFLLPRPAMLKEALQVRRRANGRGALAFVSMGCRVFESFCAHPTQGWGFRGKHKGRVRVGKEAAECRIDPANVACLFLARKRVNVARKNRFVRPIFGLVHDRHGCRATRSQPWANDLISLLEEKAQPFPCFFARDMASAVARNEDRHNPQSNPIFFSKSYELAAQK